MNVPAVKHHRGGRGYASVLRVMKCLRVKYAAKDTKKPTSSVLCVILESPRLVVRAAHAILVARARTEHFFSHTVIFMCLNASNVMLASSQTQPAPPLPRVYRVNLASSPAQALVYVRGVQPASIGSMRYVTAVRVYRAHIRKQQCAPVSRVHLASSPTQALLHVRGVDRAIIGWVCHMVLSGSLPQKLGCGHYWTMGHMIGCGQCCRQIRVGC